MCRKIWIVTGEYAYNLVDNYVTKNLSDFQGRYSIKIIRIPVKVISLATAQIIAAHLKKYLEHEKPDLIIVPGLVRGDLEKISEELGVRLVRGPARLEQLKLAFMIGVENLSPSIPAEEIIMDKIRSLIDRAASARKAESLYINRVPIPLKPPPFTTALILDHGLGLDWLEQYIRTMKPDLLALPPYTPSEGHLEIIRRLKEYSGKIMVPYQYLDMAISEGIRIHSVYGVRAAQVETVEKDICIVLESYDEPERAARKALEEPERIILDASLPANPFNLWRKLEYLERLGGIAKSAWPTNLAWGIDVDSHGLYGLLLPLLARTGVGLLFIWELEEKLYWSLQEIKVLDNMLLLSAYLEQSPRDLGIDMLLVKPKTLYFVPFEKPRRIIGARPNEKITMDPLGIFKIRVNHHEGVIEALYMGRKGRVLIRGRTAREIRDTIIREGLVSRLDHASYIGGELAKAEEALRLGLNYVQDSALLPSRNEKLWGRRSA